MDQAPAGVCPRCKTAARLRLKVKKFRRGSSRILPKAGAGAVDGNEIEEDRIAGFLRRVLGARLLAQMPGQARASKPELLKRHVLGDARISDANGAVLIPCRLEPRAVFFRLLDAQRVERIDGRPVRVVALLSPQ